MRPILRIGVGFCWATSFTIVQIFRLAVSITRSMLPDRSTQKTTSTLFCGGAFSWAKAAPATSRLITVAIIVLFIAISSSWPFDADLHGGVPDFLVRGRKDSLR